jgi:hypothetical protein
VHVWAYPTVGGSPLFLGAATLGDLRPDVGAIFGARYTPSGYHLDVTGLPDGEFDIVVYARNSASALFNARRVVRVRTPVADVRLVVDTPASGSVPPSFMVAGWALDANGLGPGSGIEAVHVWAQPTGGGAPTFLGAATLGDPRPDVAVFFANGANAGYHLNASGLAAGTYTLSVYAKAIGKPFTVVQTVTVTVTP